MALDKRRPGWGLSPWRPFKELDEIERRFEDIFGQPLMPTLWLWHSPTTETRWTPLIEVLEQEDRYIIRAELPGIKEEDIDISVRGNTLTIKGERKADCEVKEGDYYHCEWSYGSFSRLISLPDAVDAAGIEANYERGVLEITLPKATEVKPRKVPIKAKKREKG